MSAGYVKPLAADEDRDRYTTPKWLTDAIGPIWLDPCWNENACTKPAISFCLDRGEDGLALAKLVPRDPPGIVYINPPYSRGQVLQWVLAYRHTRFMFLLRHDVSTEWFRELYAVSNALAQPWRRVNFDAPAAIDTADANPYPHSLFIASPERDISPALRELCAVLRPDRGNIHA